MHPGTALRAQSYGWAPIRRAQQVGTDVRPLPVRIRFTDNDKPGATLGVGGAHYPEWDVYNERYRPQWCRVIDYPMIAAADTGHAALAPRDDVLCRRLSRVSLGPKRLRGQPDGDDVDIEAVIDLCVDLRSGYSPLEHVYLQTPQTRAQPRRSDPAGRLGIRHRHRPGWTGSTRPPASGSRHARRHSRRAR